MPTHSGVSSSHFVELFLNIFLQLIKESRFEIPLFETEIDLKSSQFSSPFRFKSDGQSFNIISFNFNEFFIPSIFTKSLQRPAFIQ